MKLWCIRILEGIMTSPSSDTSKAMIFTSKPIVFLLFISLIDILLDIFSCLQPATIIFFASAYYWINAAWSQLFFSFFPGKCFHTSNSKFLVWTRSQNTSFFLTWWQLMITDTSSTIGKACQLENDNKDVVRSLMFWLRFFSNFTADGW